MIVYMISGEVIGIGYIVGGNMLMNVILVMSGIICIIDFVDMLWIVFIIIVCGVFFYNLIEGNKVVVIF
jgi:hypothetical protein